MQRDTYIGIAILVACFGAGFFTVHTEDIVEEETLKVQGVEVIREPSDQLPVLLGTSTTSFKGSSPKRISNITVGASHINGTIIKDGQEFSFIKTLGPVSEELGYEEEHVFISGLSTMALGGGLCQVSTTLFQSAVMAGLPITERRNHTYAVRYYAPGMDATVAAPVQDMKFRNDTGSDILIKSYVVDTTLTFELYGIPDGRTVSIPPAEISDRVPALPMVEFPNPLWKEGERKCFGGTVNGFTAVVNYNVTYPNGHTNNQVFKSKYEPMQEICIKGIAI